MSNIQSVRTEQIRQDWFHLYEEAATKSGQVILEHVATEGETYDHILPTTVMGSNEAAINAIQGTVAPGHEAITIATSLVDGPYFDREVERLIALAEGLTDSAYPNVAVADPTTPIHI